MGLLADDARLDRRSGLKALLVMALVLLVGFGVAWLTLGRAARFESLKGVYLSFDLPSSFVEVEEEGSGGSLTSLGRSTTIERTYAVSLPAPKACRALERSFVEGDVDVLPVPPADGTIACSFTGPVSGYSLDADLRAIAGFVEHVKEPGRQTPSLPESTRSVATILVD